MNTAIPKDAESELDGADSGTDAFFRRIVTEDATELSEEDNDEEEEETQDEPDTEDEPDEETSETDESPEDEEDESEEDEEDADEEPEEKTKGKKTVIDSEDAVVKIKVDGEVVEASIKDLKRLYGQEASLTRKSQETAALKQQAEQTGAKYVAGLEAMLNRAKEQASPYANLNFLALTKDPNVSPEELAALSDAANKAFANVRYLETELDGVIKGAQEERQKQMMVQARETIKILSDPKTGIPGWSEKMYNDIRGFAVNVGMPEQVVNELVDPTAFKILHMAMQYEKGKTAINKTKKIDKTPKRIIKGTPEEVVKQARVAPKKSVMKRLETSGSIDDAADAFMSRWGD
jgi:hypothetical protein